MDSPELSAIGGRLLMLLRRPFLLLLAAGTPAFGAGDLMTLIAKEDKFTSVFVQSVVSLPQEDLRDFRDPDGGTILHALASRSHQLRIVTPILRGMDLNHRDHRGRSAIFEAVAADDSGWRADANMMILEMLTLAGADLDLASGDGTTPLALAAKNGDYRKAEFLLWWGASLRSPAGGPSPIALARASGDQRMVSLIESAEAVDAGKTSSTSRKRGLAALTAADLESISGMIASGWQVDEQDKQGRTALYRAVESARPEVVYLLLAAGADPNIPTKSGRTPLMASMEILTTEGQRMNAALLIAGADIHATAKNGITPLISAVSAGNDYGLLWLVGAGADLFAETPKGSLMLHADHPPTASLLKRLGVPAVAKAPEATDVGIMFEAAKRGDVACVQRALDAGVPPNATHGGERTAFDWAAYYGRFEVVDLLLQHGFDVNRQYSTSGHHPLHGLAALGGAKGGNEKVAAKHIQALLDRGADPNLVMKHGMTPLMIAAQEGLSGAVVEALLEGGARLDDRNKEGLTVLGVANKFGRTAAAEYLQKAGARE